MYSTYPIRSYQMALSAISQLPKIDNPVLSQLPGAFIVSKYTGMLNKAVTSELSNVISSVRNNTLQLNKNAKALTTTPKTFNALAPDNAATGILGSNYQYKNNTLQINQLATKQVNEGNSFTPKDTNTFAPGAYSMSLKSGSKSYQLDITIGEKETNAFVLNKVAEGINGLNAGITAKVFTNDSGDQNLVLESDNTGTNSAFEVTGTLTTALGVDQTTQEAQNAQFTFNDEDYETQNNTPALDNNKVQLNLKKVTEGTVQLDTSINTDNLANKVNAFVESYNSLQENLNNQSGNRAIKAIGNQLDKMAQNASKDLKEFGIHRDDNGQLKVEQDTLTEAIANNPDRARRLLADRNSFASKVQTRTEQFLKMPANSIADFNKQSPNPYHFLSDRQNTLIKSAFYAGNMFDLTL